MQPPSRQVIEVVDYDPAWPLRYAEERDRIAAGLAGSPVVIEHVGGTAVPGLASKPVVDIMIGVPDVERAGQAVARLIELGYEYVPELEAQLPDHRYFRRGNPDAFHIHLVDRDSDFWTEHLLFRDYLRSHPRAADEYGRLKRGLAARFRDDRKAYTEGKRPFIETVVRAARREVGHPGP